MSILEISNLNVSYDGDRGCISGLDLSVEEGEILVILGPSGCGKSTLLKVISGLMRQDSGSVFIEGRDMEKIRPEKRPVSMVFQKSLLFRNMSVSKNINYAPRLLGTMKSKELAEETERMLELVDLKGYGDRKANELSGGQEQRVSLARALITHPKILLLDEPLSALDAELRVSMRRSIREICKSLNQTVVFVTHDQEEAVAIADRIALLSEGKIQQCSEPAEFYRRPANAQVAKFFGWKNLVPCSWDGRRASCQLGDFEINRPDLGEGSCMIALRPEAVRESEVGRYEATVRDVSFMGSHTDYVLEINGIEIHASMNSGKIRSTWDKISVDIGPSGVWAVPSDSVPVTDRNVSAGRKGVFSKLFGRKS